MISIVLAADKNYFYQLMVTMASILETKNPDTDVEFYIFIDQDYTQQDKDRIDSFLASKDVTAAHFLDVSDVYADTDTHHDRITTAAYYRLKIPSSLPDHNRCLYLDVDTLVMTDLTDMYERNLEDSYLMGVLAAGYQEDENYKCHKAKILGIPNMDTYLNSGVLVFNLARMRQDNLEARFDQLLAEEFPDHDQDILNAACYGAIKLLPPEYNAMTKYEFEDDFYETDKAIPKCWSKWEWDKARKESTIVHFADQDKPWTNFAVPFAKEWWHYAEVAGVAKECFDKYFDAHAANEVKIRKLSLEKRKSELERDSAINERAQAIRDAETMRGKLEETQEDLTTAMLKHEESQRSLIEVVSKLENVQQLHDKLEVDLEAQLSLTKEYEIKLSEALAAQKATTEALTQMHNQVAQLEVNIDRLKKENEQANTHSDFLTQQLQKAKKRASSLEQSNSYRLGRALSAPYRWIKRMLKG